MDKIAALCFGFSSEHVGDYASYEKAVNEHLGQLTKLTSDSSKPLRSHGPELLNLLDPATHSLSYLAILHDLFLPSLQGDKASLSQKLVTFLLSFDPIQIRYAASNMSQLLALVASGQALPPSVAVNVLATAILRIDPTGSMLTSHHINLIKLAYNTDNIEPSLSVIDKSIVFYPGMGNHQKPKYLADPSLSPATFVTESQGFSTALKTPSLLEYDLLRGMAYCSRRDWPKALNALERVITYPTRDHGVSKIMTDAYKKWILVSLLCHGRLIPLPISVGSAATKAYSVLGKLYKELATVFETENAAELKEKSNASTEEWLADGNTGLVREVLSAYQEWQIKNLQQIYTKISVREIRQFTKSAQTGQILATDEDVEALIQNMIISGMLKGVIEKNDDGTAYLTFLPATAALSEDQLARELADTALRLDALNPIFKATNERLGTSKEYIKQLSRDRQKGGQDKEGDTAMDMLQNFDEEDLMGDGPTLNDL
ncbi:hypothetical protein PFICI_13384 [Pestalotiopsis fici W106-1]|uniref:COP9 signalosome complex subunit 3 N-terminal helical repeats domain-containing protein n=1 Tax=Pestalotiopsis fici (strain W106-1 / CGMCC3.15140) TaxID=1229662 RepID=W3WLU9_PESFW|nr:uncharacterized protein PFICI_13384 [Pestalotiopsis fici W106-1]ETS74900.1 hypothetical protein PFICI_13384 [Pestalotiopsis fici W106-1]